MKPKSALSLGRIKRLVLKMTFELNSLGRKPSFWLWELFCKLLAWFTVMLNCWRERAGGQQQKATLSHFLSSAWWVAWTSAFSAYNILHIAFTYNFPPRLSGWITSVLGHSWSIPWSSVFIPVKWHQQSVRSKPWLCNSSVLLLTKE